MSKTILLLLWITIVAGLGTESAFAHAIDHRVSGGQAKVVEVFFADGRPFSFESFEVSGPGDRSPFLIGRTDKLGRVVFIPDRSGEWSVKVWSEDGHGLQTTVVVGDSETADGSESKAGTTTSPSRMDRLTGLGVGLVLICLVGVLLTVQSRRKQS
ncbi:MAG: hypothetical protein KOO60_01950 [Gemmatimonadales bacterium]|nr:hypothetical protein [Gemmatimonadales bacterium]